MGFGNLSSSINGVPFDANVAQTIARFTNISSAANTTFTGPGWNGVEIVLQSGMTPGSATVQISVSQDNDEKMPSLCCINSSAINNIKIGDLCAIYAIIHNIEVHLFTGYVLDINQNLTKDTATISLQDHRHALSGVPIIGSFIADVDGDVSYAHANPPFINWDNRPNCALGYVDGYQVPMFCQPDMGLLPGDLIYTGTSSTAFTPVLGKACYWSPKTFWQYLWWAYTTDSAANVGLELGIQDVYLDYVFTQVADELVWDPGLEAILQGPLNSTALNTERKCVSINFQGRNLLEVLQNICLMYGQYGLDIVPYGPTEGLLDIVNTCPLIDSQGNTNGIDVLRFTDGRVQDENDPGISGGTYNLVGKDAYTRLLLSGETVFIETRVILIEDFGDSDFDQWQSEFTNLGNFDLEFVEANKAHPSVFCWYRINPEDTFNDSLDSDESIQKGTTEEGYPLAYVGRPPLQTLLSSFLAEYSGGQNIPLVSLMNSHFPIYFEVSYDYDPEHPELATWLLCTNGSDDFTIEPNGRIRLNGLRNISTTGTGTFQLPGKAGRYQFPLDIKSGTIRATFAIPLDHAVRAGYRLASDINASTLPIQTNPDADRIATSYSRAAFENLGGQNLYDYWIRNKSYPTPNTRLTAPGGLSSIIRDDLPYLAKQAQIRAYQMLRIPKSGELIYPFILPDFRPGVSISTLVNQGSNTNSDYDLDAIVNRVTFACGDFENTRVGLG